MMLRFRPTLPALGLTLATASLPAAAFAQPGSAAQAPTRAATAGAAPGAPAASVPPGLVGAWGSDSSCTADVAIFRADGTVLNPAAPAGTPPVTYTVNGDSITLAQGGQSGTFAFALSDQAVAWSNGSAIELKERCADQSPFAAALKTAASAPAGTAAIPAGPLPDQIRALAGEPVLFQGQMVEIQAVESSSQKTLPYTGFRAKLDPQKIGQDAHLLYRIFPTAAAAADYVSLASDKQTSFLHEPHGSGFFSTASAMDEGPADAKAPPVSINCLRFHPKRMLAVTISCFAQMPGTKLVAGGEQTFTLPKGTKANDMGPKDDLSQTLSLTGLAISQLRGFLAAYPQP
jgi:hypothetical protein